MRELRDLLDRFNAISAQFAEPDADFDALLAEQAKVQDEIDRRDAWQFSFFAPDDFAPLLTFFAWMIVILGGLGRAWTVPVGAVVFGVIFAGTRFFDFAPFSLLDSTERAYLRLILIGAVIIGLMLFRPQGILGKREEMVLE